MTTASPSSAWAVGSFITKADPFGKPYIEHWNGHAWKQVSAPLGFLSGAVSTSTRNTWAVGGTGGDNLDFPLVSRSKGGAWTRAHVPIPPTGGHLFGVAATSSSNAWAVGHTGPASRPTALILRWNGSTWK